MRTIIGKTLVMLIALATLTLSSCSKSPEDMIVGQWDVALAEIVITEQGNTETLDITDDYDSFEFTADKSCTIHIRNHAQDGSATTNDLNGTYTITELQLTITIDNKPTTYDIDVMEKDFMIITTSNSNGGNTDITQTIRLEKIK